MDFLKTISLMSYKDILTVLAIYLFFLNLIGVLITVSDKNAAKKHKWRTPENELMIVSALGGSVGMLITMKLIHHKTKHRKFMVGIPVIIVFQVILILAFFAFKFFILSK